jgi:hypothetical protein
MKIPIQNIDFKKSPYERPNQKWVCGWAAQGKPCPHGPNGAGKCAIEDHSTCAPYQDQNTGRYHCNRPTVFGGKCDNGPLPDGSCCSPEPVYHPCQPQLSMRAQRSRLTWLVFTFVFVMMTVLLSSQIKWQILNPGPLSSSHAALSENNDLNCASCHVAGDQSLAQWVTLALNPDEHQHQMQHQCISCHFDDNTSLALMPHNEVNIDQLTLQAIATLESNADKPPVHPQSGELTFLKLSQWLHDEPEKNTQQVECVSCHKEHKGIDGTQISMTNNQCQSCHTNQFNSFVEGHPEFHSQGKAQRALLFNHKDHKKYFDNETMPCLQCHSSDMSLSKMTLQPFEQSCQGCHHQNSNDHHDDGLKKDLMPVFDLPYITFDDYPAWPEDAEASELSAILIALLAGNENTKDLIHTLFLTEDEDGYEGDLEYWLDDQEEQDKVEFAEGIMQIINMLSQPKSQAESEVQKQLAASVGEFVPEEILFKLSENLVSSGAIASILTQMLAGDVEGDLSYEEDVAGWVFNPDTFSLNYRAIQHGDPLLGSLMQTSAALNEHYDELDEVEHPAIIAFTDNLNDTFKSCSNCHNTQLSAPLNWSSDALSRHSVGFGKFSHDTHVRVGDKLPQCASCHDESTEKVLDFSPVEKQSCTSCHEPRTQLDQCTTCHNYHNFSFSMMESKP